MEVDLVAEFRGKGEERKGGHGGWNGFLGFVVALEG